MPAKRFKSMRRNLPHPTLIQLATMRQLRAHWPEDTIEATCLALFMISATGVATLLYHPSSPLSACSAGHLRQRIPMGIAMGLTNAALIYSPLGARSGAHMNPAVTLTFLRLAKITPLDAAAYVLAQFLGGLAGIAIAASALAGLPAHPAVNYVATIPGRTGSGIAFVAELVISFLLMSVVLRMSNTPQVARFTGLGASLLVATCIIFEAPFSGMSMNPARTLGSNVFASMLSTLWIYFIAPPLGMSAAPSCTTRDRCPFDFPAAALDVLDVRVECGGEHAAGIPRHGPLIVAANHPHGALEGLLLLDAIGRMRPDLRLVANHLLARIPELRELCFFVDRFEHHDSAQRSLAGLRAAHRWLQRGGALLIFPAAEVAPVRRADGLAIDSSWRSTIGRLAIGTRARVLPVGINGANSRMFYVAGRVHPLIRTVLLPRELLKRRAARCRSTSVGPSVSLS